MDPAELKKIAERARFMREAGMALVLASGVLAIFLLLPPFSKDTPGATSPAVAAPPAGGLAAPDAFARIPLHAKAAIVYDLATGKTLYAKNADAQLPLASLTKLLTVYAAFDELAPQATIAIPADVVSLTAPRAFAPGETFALNDLARLTLTASLNDGATAIASATAAHKKLAQGEMLAATAAALNLSQTYAVNGSGLDVNGSVSGGYGSARDLARLAGALVAKAPDVALATTQSVTTARSAEGASFSVKNTDPIVDTIPNLLLSKTGYTDLAGGNLALVFDAGIEHPIAIVVLGSSKEARFTDGSALMSATLAHFAGVSSLP